MTVQIIYLCALLFKATDTNFGQLYAIHLERMAKTMFRRTFFRMNFTLTLTFHSSRNYVCMHLYYMFQFCIRTCRNSERTASKISIADG